MMTQGCRDFQGRGEVETLSRARIETMSNGVHLTRRVPRRVGALGQVRAQQPCGGVSAAVLPGAVRIGKKHQDREPFHQGADGRIIASPLEEVAFPVPGHGAGGHLGGGSAIGGM